MIYAVTLGNIKAVNILIKANALVYKIKLSGTIALYYINFLLLDIYIIVLDLLLTVNANAYIIFPLDWSILYIAAIYNNIIIII